MRPTAAALALGVTALLIALVATVLVWLGRGIQAPGQQPGTGRVGAAATASPGGAFRFWSRDGGRPVGWNPCRPIRWVLNPDGAPPGARGRLRAAMADLAEVAGLRFSFAGVTDEVPGRQRAAYQPDRYGDRWAPVLIGWAHPHDNGLPLRDVDRAVAIPVAVRQEGPDVFVTGQIVFNRRGPDPGEAGRYATALHELGHLVGLDHVDDAAQLMYRFPGRSPGELGPGDRAGLRRLGRRAGCRPGPDPGPVDVAYADPRRAVTPPGRSPRPARGRCR